MRGQTEYGLSVDPDTLYWWMNQSDGARQPLTTENKILLKDMCDSLQRFIYGIDSSGERLRLWGNGASYDNAIIRLAFRQVGKEFPIKFWNDRDMRTIVGFYPRQLQEQWRKTNLRSGTYHNALDDAKHQVKYCSHILQAGLQLLHYSGF